MTEIFCFDISKIDSEYDLLYKNATPERKEKADRYKNQDDKIRCIVAGAILEYALKTWLSYKDKEFNESMLETAYNRYGKPYLKNVKGFYYNISHCDKWVVLAYSENEIGVDIEMISEKSQDTRKHLVNRYFTENEKSYVFEKNKIFAKRFIEIWSGKECYLKYKGTGIANQLTSADVLLLKEKGLVSVIFDANYYLSYFSEEENVSVKEIEYNMLY